jgi:hypothetical protein
MWPGFCFYPAYLIVEACADTFTLLFVGNDVVVVVHSAGGVTGSEATKNLSKPERENAGKKGGVVRMVYLCAFAAPEGVGVYNATRGPMPWQDVTETTSFPHDPMYRFYHDVDPELAQQAIANLGKHSLKAKWSPATYAAWKHIPSTYLLCEADRAIPLEVQEAMIAAPGANFTVERCASGHSPWMVMPDFTADVVRRAAGEKI